MSEGPFVAVLDYGRGNLRSVVKALGKVGAPARVVRSARGLGRAAGLLVPGVGAFGDAMAALRKAELTGFLKSWVADGRPLLGVCLGLQILCRDSDEFGPRKGLGFFDAPVRRFGAGLKIPHMGWNQVSHDPACPLFEGLRQGEPFYFVHSYRVARGLGAAGVAAESVYGRERFASALWRGGLYATQFHPEKSQAAGLRLYRNFWGLCRRAAAHGGRGA